MKSRFVKKIIASGALMTALAVGVAATAASANSTRIIPKAPVNLTKTLAINKYCTIQYMFGTYNGTAYAKIRVSKAATGYMCQVSASVTAAKGTKILHGQSAYGYNAGADSNITKWINWSPTTNLAYTTNAVATNTDYSSGVRSTGTPLWAQSNLASASGFAADYRIWASPKPGITASYDQLSVSAF